MLHGAMTVGHLDLCLGIDFGTVRNIRYLDLFGDHADQAGSHLPFHIGAHICRTSPATVFLSVVIDTETPRYNHEPSRELAAAVRQVLSKALKIVPLQLVEQKAYRSIPSS